MDFILTEKYVKFNNWTSSFISFKICHLPSSMFIPYNTIGTDDTKYNIIRNKWVELLALRILRRL